MPLSAAPRPLPWRPPNLFSDSGPTAQSTLAVVRAVVRAADCYPQTIRGNVCDAMVRGTDDGSDADASHDGSHEWDDASMYRCALPVGVAGMSPS